MQLYKIIYDSNALQPF